MNRQICCVLCIWSAKPQQVALQMAIGHLGHQAACASALALHTSRCVHQQAARNKSYSVLRKCGCTDINEGTVCIGCNAMPKTLVTSAAHAAFMCNNQVQHSCSAGSCNRGDSKHAMGHFQRSLGGCSCSASATHSAEVCSSDGRCNIP